MYIDKSDHTALSYIKRKCIIILSLEMKRFEETIFEKLSTFKRNVFLPVFFFFFFRFIINFNRILIFECLMEKNEVADKIRINLKRSSDYKIMGFSQNVLKKAITYYLSMSLAIWGISVEF